MFDFKYITEYDSKSNGIAQITYDINYINDEWDVIVQKYD